MNKFNDFVSKTYTLSNAQDNFVPNINIAFAIDKNYLKPCGITLYSITKNNPDINIDFHIFTTFFDPKGGEFKHEVRQFEKSYDNQQAEQISLMV